MTSYILPVILSIIILALCWLLRYLSVDPNYGILTAAAGLPLIRYDRRRRDLILLDLDNFKAYNTMHGHSEADRRVRSVWRTGPERRAGVRLTFRRSDRVLVVKRGGDELLLSCPSGQADAVVAIVRARLAAVNLTATVCVQSNARNMDAMLQEAEKMILALKACNRKNTVAYIPITV